ncbi:hypothetical protein [Thiogranum longum]|uniref:DUF7931 domain-containing protein n=1 Tax=Thiogranum longum TaxID=1537524 RepID=UPI001053B714|nr:hypothetical protein [Thiogranum longum]
MKNEENFQRFVKLQLGLSDLDIELDSRADTAHATNLMAKQAQDTLDIFSRNLDPGLYEQNDFLDNLGNLCLRNRKARIRFLVQQPEEAVKRCQRLLELARKLSSSIELRQPHPDYRHHNEAFMIADQCGLVYRKMSDRYEGTANFYNPVEAKRKTDFFTEVWERSEVHPEFRRLYL